MRVAIVDDQSDLTWIYRSVAQDLGCNITSYLNGAGLISEIRATGGCFYDLVLLDLAMPIATGVDVIDELSLLASKPPVVIMSGESSTLMCEAKQAAELGGVTVVETLRKPFRLDTLRQLIWRIRD